MRRDGSALTGGGRDDDVGRPGSGPEAGGAGAIGRSGVVMVEGEPAAESSEDHQEGETEERDRAPAEEPLQVGAESGVGTGIGRAGLAGGLQRRNWKRNRHDPDPFLSRKGKRPTSIDEDGAGS